MAGGEEPDDLRERLRGVRTREQEFAAAADLLESRLRDRRRRRVQHEAERRLRSIRKKVGGLAGEAPRQAEKTRELAEELTRQLEWLAHAPLRRQLLKREAGALADAFGLEVLNLRRSEEDPHSVVADAKRTVSRAAWPREGLGLLTEPDEVVRVLGRLYDEDSPMLNLLDRLRELKVSDKSSSG